MFTWFNTTTKPNIVQRTLIINSKVIKRTPVSDTVDNIDFLPADCIFTEIINPTIEEFNSDVGQFIQVRILSNEKRKMTIQLTGKICDVDIFIDKLTVNPEMLKYAEWDFR